MTAEGGPPPAPPATIVIFGATGDLTRRLLMPALANLCGDGLIGDDLTVIGVAREGDDESLRKGLDEFAPAGACWQALRGRVTMLPGDFTGDEVFAALKARLGEASAAFYLATAPQYFGQIVERLARAGLMEEAEGRFRRVVIEKPFGHDLASARDLNRQILACIGEPQIYRLDHFLGKETVQNILVARFANPVLEAVWNARYIDHVQITAAETVDVGTRGAFYDATGALRDMVPNHLMQLLALVGMEPPNGFDAEAIRNEKAKLLTAIHPPKGEDAVRGRYLGGTIGDRAVTPYAQARDVDPVGTTETYAALTLRIDSWRWTGVPFYLRTGKALAARDTEIVIAFKPAPLALFKGTDVAALPPNRLVIQLQPAEALRLDISVKQPGPDIDVAAVDMRFTYADRFKIGGRTGYETLLYDMLIGDQTLFQRADMIEAGWAAVQPILDAWGADKAKPEDYPAGSGGPASADALIARDGRAWAAIG